MSYTYYAKSDPVETIKEHTDKLLENLNVLKEVYGDKIAKSIEMPEDRFWHLMQIICKYHDAGKVFTGFQNVIRNKIGEPLIKTRFNNLEIKHEQISPAMVPYKEYCLNPDERKLVYQAIYYHHERKDTFLDRKLLNEIIEEEIKPNIQNIQNELQIKIDEVKITYLNFVDERARIVEGDALYKEYCLMKGLLNRLDHSSSAGLFVEDKTDDNLAEFVEQFMKNNDYKLNDLQSFAKEKCLDNVIVVGSTGMGKTEGALLWSGSDKTFFTLPLRISINAIYDRIKEIICYQHVGLLHATAFEHLNETNESGQLVNIEQSRSLCEKVTACTIDQLFPFVFKYRGYEKIYATLGYSKVIIDEIQAYSPEIVAVILKGLQMINSIGGQFMVMTATLPRIYKEKLQEMGVSFEYNEFVKDTKRHRIKLMDKAIDEDIEELKFDAESKKVLVIVNTVNKAIALYKKLKNIGTQNVNVLHSRFIQSDRNKKEKDIKSFSKSGATGIWITTQIVEASLDIDFDMLYTEMSTLDSLFQRLGRCFRSREYLENIPNVKIYEREVSGIGYIYDKEIHEKSVMLLQDYDEKILEEKTKISLVDKLYSKEYLQGTEFYKKFEDSFRVLNNVVDYDTSKKEAQHILRNIDNIEVIPKIVYDNNLNLFDEYEKTINFYEKYELKKKIDSLFISINSSNKYRLKDVIVKCPYIEGKYIIYTDYNGDTGLSLTFDEEYLIDSRLL